MLLYPGNGCHNEYCGTLGRTRLTREPEKEEVGEAVEDTQDGKNRVRAGHLSSCKAEQKLRLFSSRSHDESEYPA